LSSGDVVVKLIGNDPWQKFVDAIDGMLGDASDDVAQVGLVIQQIGKAVRRDVETISRVISVGTKVGRFFRWRCCFSVSGI
jgi:hypothetical protein